MFYCFSRPVLLHVVTSIDLRIISYKIKDSMYRIIPVFLWLLTEGFTIEKGLHWYYNRQHCSL